MHVEGSRISILVGSDFDGYLAELAKGLVKEVKRAGISDVKFAVILPDEMMQEANLAHLSTSGDVVRAFGLSDIAAVQDWLVT